MATNIDIHYTWVGPPHKDNHDIEGPLPLVRALKNTKRYKYTCYFWCLDRYVDAFKRKLKGLDITVRGIEHFLTNCGGTSYKWYYWYGSKEDDAVARVREVICVLPTKATQLWDRVNTRDIVNAKNVWSFFLLYTWGGYHFDTGIKPLNDAKLALKAYDTFKAPRSEDNCVCYQHKKIIAEEFLFKCSAIINEGSSSFGKMDRGEHEAPQYDIWALYSPRHDYHAFVALTWYCRAWAYLRGANLDPETYRQAFRSAVMNAIYTALTHDAKMMCTRAMEVTEGWVWSKDRNTVPELGIEKVFHGSHRKGDDDEKKVDKK